ncbi:MAG: carbohydrate deacetylase [Candidatus Aminicenantales bacterium]
MSPPRVIVNADDFGLCSGVNQGIVQAYRHGILTSASLMTNTPGFEEAVALAQENPGLGIGVHLNIVRGVPLLPPEKVSTIVRRDGYFFGKVFPLFSGIWRKKVNLEEIEREWRAQIEKALGTGVQVTHLDSEKHVHTFPPLFRLCLKLAAEHGIFRVRFIRERCLSWPLAQMVKAAVVTRWCLSQKPNLEGMGIKVTDHFLGFCRAGKVTARWLRKVLEHLPEGTTEIMTHPGYLTSDLLRLEKNFGSYYINRRREVELKALLAPELKALVQKLKVQLISYRFL